MLTPFSLYALPVDLPDYWIPNLICSGFWPYFTFLRLWLSFDGRLR